LLTLTPLQNIPLIRQDDNLADILLKSLQYTKIELQNDDILVVAQKIVSKAEGRMRNIADVVPSVRALELAEKSQKDARVVELMLQESNEVLRVRVGTIIVEHKLGFVCANAGIDRSNVSGDRNVVPLPKNPNASAENIRKEVKLLAGVDVAVIVSDTHGRPFRVGEINVAVGVAGIKPIRDRRGEKDLFGYVLRVKQTAIADELSSAAELVIGQADEGIPAAIIRGYKYSTDENAAETALIRPKERDLFR